MNENENIRNVSVIALTLRKLQCLKVNAVINPNSRPTSSETVPSIMVCPKITNGVYHAKSTLWS